MTGISEILILVLLITCILILPRIFKGEPDKKVSSLKKINTISVQLRLSIVLTLAYPIIIALYFKPWNNNLIIYLTYGIIPVSLAWALAWIVAGKKKR